MQWLEVSLIVDSELAEAVAEVLARFAPNGVVIGSTAIETDLEDEGHVIGPFRVCAYLPFDEKIKVTRHQIDTSLWHLGRIKPMPQPEYKTIQEVNWAETWKGYYKPIPIGKRLMILPSWMDSPDEVRIPIRIDPGMAFGTGTHPSTQLCLQMLEIHIPVGRDIFDIGCGSGILSVAALKLGARHAYGVDIEVESIENANKNAAINQVTNQIDFSLGSVKEIKAGIFKIRRASLVLANILTHILIRLIDNGLPDLLESEGVLILSGILEEQLSELEPKIREHGLQIIERSQIDDWVALAIQP